MPKSLTTQQEMYNVAVADLGPIDSMKLTEFQSAASEVAAQCGVTSPRLVACFTDQTNGSEAVCDITRFTLTWLEFINDVKNEMSHVYVVDGELYTDDFGEFKMLEKYDQVALPVEIVDPARPISHFKRKNALRLIILVAFLLTLLIVGAIGAALFLR